MESDDKLLIMKGIDVEEAAENFMASQSVLDESIDLSRSRIEKIEEMIARKEIHLSDKEWKRIDKLSKRMGVLVEMINEEIETSEDKLKNKELFEEVQRALKRLIECNYTAFNLIREDLDAFKEIEEKAGDVSDLLQSSGQGTTYMQIFWNVISKYLSTNNITSHTPINERPNVFAETSVHLKRIHMILNENTANQFSRTRLCLGCWMLISVDTTANRNRKNYVYKKTGLPMMMKFSSFLDTKQSHVHYERSIYLEDLIYFMYQTKHTFFSIEAEKIFSLKENEDKLSFMPCPLVKKPKIGIQGIEKGMLELQRISRMSQGDRLSV